MKAMKFTDKLNLQPVILPVPQPKAGETLIQVYATRGTPIEKLWYTTSHNADGSTRSKAKRQIIKETIPMKLTWHGHSAFSHRHTEVTDEGDCGDGSGCGNGRGEAGGAARAAGGDKRRRCSDSCVGIHRG